MTHHSRIGSQAGNGSAAHSRAAGFFRHLVEHAGEGILVADVETRRFVYANPAVCALLGYSERELLRLAVPDIHPPEAVAYVLDEFDAQARREKLLVSSIPCRRKDGTVFYADIAATSMELAGRVCNVGFFNDITERAESERRLREQEEERRLVLESIPEVVYRVDLPGHDPMRGVVGFVSGRVAELLGLAPERFIADPDLWASLLHPDDAPAVAAQTQRLLAGEATVVREYRIRHGGGGEYRWLEDRVTLRRTADGRPTGFFGVARDVTERHRAETELREVARVLQESQRVARLGSYRLDIPSGLWTGSPVLDEIFGLAEPGFRRDIAAWVGLLHPDDRDELARYFAEQVLAARQSFDREYRIVRRCDGATRWVHGLGELLIDADGRVIEMIGTIQDITERRQADQEKLDLERRLLHAQKLESLGVLTGGIAHDFNNLLMSILGNLELAALKLPADAPAAESVRRAVQAAERSAALTRQMLAYSGRGATVVHELDLSQLVEENVHLLRAMIAKNVTLELALERALPPLRGDAGQLQQVVMNLITNASEAIGDRPGTIRLATRSEPCDAALLSRSRVEEIPPPGRFVVLEVTDDGCGMDEATLLRLFDPFFTTKAMGRGLGTSAILGIVRGHHGAILVESQPGQGTRVRVLLPEAPAPAAAPSPTPGSAVAAPPAPAVAARTRTVLVVDDEPAVLGVAREMLQGAGYAVLTAADGEEAVAEYRRHPGAIDCVVLDLSMPRLDGIATLQALRQTDPAVAAVLASGHAMDDVLRRCAAHPPGAYLQKPYSLQELVAAVGGALRAAAAE